MQLIFGYKWYKEEKRHFSFSKKKYSSQKILLYFKPLSLALINFWHLLNLEIIKSVELAVTSK